MVIPTYFQLRPTVNLMSQQSTQSQPTQAVYFFYFFILLIIFFSITLKECQKHPGNIL